MALPRQTLPEVSVSVVVSIVLLLFLAVILSRSPWPTGPPRLTVALVVLFLVPIVVLGGVTYVAAVRLDPTD